jgi:hypothetical protein
MKINDIDRARNLASLRRKKTSDSSAAGLFDSYLEQAEASHNPAPVEESATILSPSAIFFAQAYGQMPEAKEKTLQRGNQLLDMLEMLRAELLTEEVAPVRLMQIQELIAENRAITTDASLQQIMDEIELRACVELAKLGLL